MVEYVVMIEYVTYKDFVSCERPQLMNSVTSTWYTNPASP